MTGTMTLLGKTYSIVEAELHVPVVDETRLLYLGVGAADGGFGIWAVEVPLLEGLEDLDGKRLHVHWGGETFADDTLGTDTVGADSTTDLNYWQGENASYTYGEIQVDFSRVEGRRYRCRVRCTLADANEVSGEPSPGEFAIAGMAEFVVTVDEVDPYAYRTKA